MHVFYLALLYRKDPAADGDGPLLNPFVVYVSMVPPLTISGLRTLCQGQLARVRGDDYNHRWGGRGYPQLSRINDHHYGDILYLVVLWRSAGGVGNNSAP